jgi:hypothetical protein
VAEQLGDIGVEHDDSVTRGHLHVVLGADFDAAVLPARTTAPPPPTEPAPTDPIAAAGVPCID